MTTTEILLIINSALLSLIGVLFVVVGFFLKDFHRDFKELVGQVNTLSQDHRAHVSAYEMIRDMSAKQIDTFSTRLRKVEMKLKRKG